MVHAILYLVIGLVAGLFTGLFGIGGGSVDVKTTGAEGSSLPDWHTPDSPASSNTVWIDRSAANSPSLSWGSAALHTPINMPSLENSPPPLRP